MGKREPDVATFPEVAAKEWQPASKEFIYS